MRELITIKRKLQAAYLNNREFAPVVREWQLIKPTLTDFEQAAILQAFDAWLDSLDKPVLTLIK